MCVCVCGVCCVCVCVCVCVIKCLCNYKRMVNSEVVNYGVRLTIFYDVKSTFK